MSVKNYFAPGTIEECLNLLCEYQGEAALIAGGTDLMLWLEQGKLQPKALVDTTRIAGLQEIRFAGGEVTIGAAVTHAQIAVHPRIYDSVRVLADACMSVGSPQIRNVATLAGNVVAAQPAADSAIALIALGAEAEIVSAGGTRVEPVKNLYAGVGCSKVDHTRELITCFRFPIGQRAFGSAFERISPRKALALPMVNAGVVLACSDGIIRRAGMAIGPVSSQPWVPIAAEQALLGAKLDDEAAFKVAAVLAAEAASPRDSLLRGSAAYRRTLVRDLVLRAIHSASSRAGQQ